VTDEVPDESAFGVTVKAWSAVLKADIEPHQVAKCLLISKLINDDSPDLRELWVDIASMLCLLKEEQDETI